MENPWLLPLPQKKNLQTARVFQIVDVTWWKSVRFEKKGLIKIYQHITKTYLSKSERNRNMTWRQQLYILKKATHGKNAYHADLCFTKHFSRPKTGIASTSAMASVKELPQFDSRAFKFFVNSSIIPRLYLTTFGYMFFSFFQYYCTVIWCCIKICDVDVLPSPKQLNLNQPPTLGSHRKRSLCWRWWQ